MLAISSALAQIEFVNPLPQPNPFYGLVFVDASHGWAIASRGTMLRTTDGGASWSLSFPLPFDESFLSISFVDRNRGWALVEQPGITYGWRLLRTIDGGLTWNDLPFGDAEFPRMIHFIDRNHGWLVDDAGVRRTSDGGEHWQLATHSGYGKLFSIFAFDSNHVWAAGNEGLIIGSTDGGAHWSVQHQDPPSRTGAKTHIFRKLHFVDSLKGWAVGSRLFLDGNFGACIFNTTDGGVTWREQYQAEPTSWLQAFYDVDFSGPHHGIAVAGKGIILVTPNGGATWETRRDEKNAHILRDIYSVGFLDGMRAWAVGAAGQMLNTVDGGFTWNEYSSGIPGKDSIANFYTIHFIDSLHGFVSGDYFDALLYETTDGGRSWMRRDDYRHRSDVSVIERFRRVGSGDLWGVGFEGTIVRSTDNGATWERKESGTRVNIMGISFPTSSVGWAVSGTRYSSRERATILRTLDGGESWEIVDTSSVNDWFGVHFITPDRGWIVGEQATILSTTDGGAHWEKVPVKNKGTLNDIFFVDAEHGWIAGDNGIILRTSDGGITWEEQQLTPPVDILSLQFVDPVHGWAVGGSGYAFYTSDGGRSWQRVDLRTYNYIYSVHLLDKNNGWIAGAGGLIIRIHGAPAATVSNHVVAESPERIVVEPVAPNPVNDRARLRYTLRDGGHVVITLNDASGSPVRTLLDARPPSGEQMLDLDLGGLSSGIYYCTIAAGGISRSVPVVICR